LEFGQPIVDAIFVQKVLIFLLTCGLVLASRRTSFYKIPIIGLAIMPQKQNYFQLRALLGNQKHFILFNLFGLHFFSEILNKVLKNILNMKKF
jgi:hypothetical protein